MIPLSSSLSDLGVLLKDLLSWKTTCSRILMVLDGIVPRSPLTIQAVVSCSRRPTIGCQVYRSLLPAVLSSIGSRCTYFVFFLFIRDSVTPPPLLYFATLLVPTLLFFSRD